MEASRNGKEVTALIELKARFDEENNIQWARQLEEAGVHVVYGIVGLKIHAKVSLVIRREGEKLRAYAHLGTGNYHPRTARIYTDLSLFTCDRALTGEVISLFHSLTGFGRASDFHRLLVAPYNLHARIQQLIRREAAKARRGLPSGITIKVNSLVDRETILNLYHASRCGVPIQLIVRGICALVPGVKGLSETIRVRSVVGRFLEHSRIYHFLNAGGEPTVLLGSADWMPRNFFRRIEVVFPVRDRILRQRVTDEILAVLLADDHDARELRPSGAYAPVPHRSGRHAFSSQQEFLDLAES
jgi:polyphosphate kinase